MLRLTLLLALTACSTGGARHELGRRPTAAAADRAAPQAPRQYWFGMIRQGPSWSAEQTEASAQLQREHLENIGRLVGEGKLVLAGPFDNGDGDERGLFIFDVETRAEAVALVQSDPAVQAGRLVVDLLPWWGTGELRGLLDG